MTPIIDQLREIVPDGELSLRRCLLVAPDKLASILTLIDVSEAEPSLAGADWSDIASGPGSLLDSAYVVYLWPGTFVAVAVAWTALKAGDFKTAAAAAQKAMALTEGWPLAATTWEAESEADLAWGRGSSRDEAARTLFDSVTRDPIPMEDVAEGLAWLSIHLYVLAQFDDQLRDFAKLYLLVQNLIAPEPGETLWEGDRWTLVSPSQLSRWARWLELSPSFQLSLDNISALAITNVSCADPADWDHLEFSIFAHLEKVGRTDVVQTILRKMRDELREELEAFPLRYVQVGEPVPVEPFGYVVNHKLVINDDWRTALDWTAGFRRLWWFWMPEQEWLGVFPKWDMPSIPRKGMGGMVGATADARALRAVMEDAEIYGYVKGLTAGRANASPEDVKSDLTAMFKNMIAEQERMLEEQARTNLLLRTGVQASIEAGLATEALGRKLESLLSLEEQERRLAREAERLLAGRPRQEVEAIEAQVRGLLSDRAWQLADERTQGSLWAYIACKSAGNTELLRFAALGLCMAFEREAVAAVGSQPTSGTGELTLGDALRLARKSGRRAFVPILKRTQGIVELRNCLAHNQPSELSDEQLLSKAESLVLGGQAAGEASPLELVVLERRPSGS